MSPMPALSAADFPSSRRVHRGLQVVPAIDSTNAELVRRERVAAQPHFTALVTLTQTQGKGRLDRRWIAEPETSVAISVVLRPQVPFEKWGLVTLLGGLAAQRAVATELPDARVELKWPNDVLVGGRKIVGVLAQLVPETGAIVLGIGINTTMTEAQLPVPTATSIAIESGASLDGRAIADALLTEVLAALAGLMARFEAAEGDIDRARLRDELEAACGTLGLSVDVALPGGETITGRAIGIGADGALMVATGEAAPSAVLAGDITHLRYA